MLQVRENKNKKINQFVKETDIEKQPPQKFQIHANYSSSSRSRRNQENSFFRFKSNYEVERE